MAASLKDLERARGLRSLYAFGEMAWPYIDPRPFQGNWHIEEVCTHLSAVTRGECRFLILSQPPNTGKSIWVDVIWPVWEWLHLPANRVASVSYDGRLTLRDAGKSLALIQTPWFQERWGDLVSVPKHKPAEGDYKTAKGGHRFATFIGGAFTGRHFDRVSVNDPIKPKDVTGKVLENVSKWWNETLPSRLEPKTGALILTMQRLHEADPTGIALAEKAAGARDWVHLRLPMKYEAEAPCQTPFGGDRRTEEGELLWPDRFPEEEVRQLARNSRMFAAQYQQRPVPEGGQIFKREWFGCWVPAGQAVTSNEGELRILPSKFDKVVLSVDCAFKDGDGNDYVAIQVWGKKGPDYYLLDQDYGHMGFGDTVAAIRKMRRKWPKAHTVLVEDKANGSAVIETLRKEMSGIVPVNPEGGKVARANAVVPLFEGRNVYHPHPEIRDWVDELRDEMVAFPFARHDDRTDATTQALVYFLGRTSNHAKAMEQVRKMGWIPGVT